jgi:hypothetical protein
MYGGSKGTESYISLQLNDGQQIVAFAPFYNARANDWQFTERLAIYGTGAQKQKRATVKKTVTP